MAFKRGYLTPKQAMFVREYLIDLNITQAAIRAGYSPRAAGATGRETLANPLVAKAVRSAMDRRAATAEIDANWVLRELLILEKANMADYVDLDAEGGPKVSLANLTREQTAAISEITVDTIGEMVTRTKFKLHDKQKALDSIGKHIAVGAFEERHAHRGSVVLNYDEQDKDA